MFGNVTTGCRVQEHFVVGDGQAGEAGVVQEGVGEALFESMSRRFKKRLMDANARKGRDQKEDEGSAGAMEGEEVKPEWCHTREVVADNDQVEWRRKRKANKGRKKKKKSDVLGMGARQQSSPRQPMSWCGMALWHDDPASKERADSHDDALEESRDESDGGSPIASHANVKSAWLNAAMAWRQRNMPSPMELKKRKAEMSRRMSEAARKRHAKPRPSTFQSGQGGVVMNIPEKPSDDASEADWKVYFRLHHSARISQATSFVQVLRMFDVPCVDPKKIKFSYMQAVRMYHPDSNSKSRCWRTGREKAEAEEIMKLINQRKPDDFSLG